MRKLYLFFVLIAVTFNAIGFCSEKVISLFLVGTGVVGKELLSQIKEKFSADNSTEIRLIGMANSQRMVFSDHGISLNHWEHELYGTSLEMNVDQFVGKMFDCKLPNRVFVDCTSSQLIADRYQQILKGKIPIIAANKKANAGSALDYSILRHLGTDKGIFLYDTNVGAGLPIIKAIQSIKRNGDSIVKIEAILSGTLSYLFNTFDGSIPFSKILREAQEKGFTEPDPRDDLNGFDMARKFLILARESGLMLEMSDIIIEPFINNDCFAAATISDFYHKLELFDDQFNELARQAKQNGQKLRFMGTLENGRAILSLKAINSDHPFYNLTDTDNIVSIHSQIYSKNPVVIKGPGAGARVTAANVLSNIIEAIEKQ